VPLLALELRLLDLLRLLLLSRRRRRLRLFRCFSFFLRLGRRRVTVP
jgi:hypothetical protein